MGEMLTEFCEEATAIGSTRGHRGLATGYAAHTLLFVVEVEKTRGSPVLFTGEKGKSQILEISPTFGIDDHYS